MSNLISCREGDFIYLLYCDESNLEYKPGYFFVYAGLAIPDINALSLSKRIDEIKQEYLISHEFSLKFNPGPPNMSHPDFISLKQDVIRAAIDAECEVFASLILHDIAKDPHQARLKEINRIAYHFNCFLQNSKDSGLILLDRFVDKDIDEHTKEKFNIGITNLPYSKEYRLDRVLGLHYSAIGQSNFASIIDIILGSLRFSINEHTKNPSEPKESSIEILKLLSPLFPKMESGYVSEINLFFSPKTIRVSSYRTRYNNLRDFLISCDINPAQTIEQYRTY